LDIGPNDLEQEGWACAPGKYHDGKITCLVPKIEDFEQEFMSYNVDIALNGQQFSGIPLQFKYYDVKIERIEPNLVPSEGGTKLTIIGTGMYDSSQKKIRIYTDKGTREIAGVFEPDKNITCKIPPLTWLFGGEDVSPETIEETLNQDVRIDLTLNGIEWIQAMSFRYHDVKIARVTFATGFGEGLDEEAKKAAWLAEDVIPPPPEVAPTPEELAKKAEEEKAKIAEEAEEVLNMAKRFGTKMYVYGDNFVKSKMSMRCVIGEVSVPTPLIWKKNGKMGFNIPDMGETIPIGEHPCAVEISANG
jgi:hypothetical protein